MKDADKTKKQLIDELAQMRRLMQTGGQPDDDCESARQTVAELAHIIGVRDITGLKGRERALQESEEKFRLLFEKSPDATFLIVDDTVIDCNEAALKLLRCPSKQSMIGRRPSMGAPERQPDGRLSSEKADAMHAALVREGAIHFEWLGLNFEGEEFWSEISQTLIPLQGRQIIFTVSRDITERKKGEAALRESEERYRIAIENSNDAVAIVGGIEHIYVNQRFLDLFGYDRVEDVIGLGLEVFLCPEDRVKVKDYSRKRQCGEEAPSRYECKSVRKDGTAVYCEVSAATVTYLGQPASLVYLRDITERRRMEEERLRLAAAVEQAAEGISICDAEGMLLYVNPSTCAMTGYARVELLGQQCDAVWEGGLHGSVVTPTRETAATGPWSGRAMRRRKDGSRYFCEVTISPIKEATGTITHYVGLTRDVTQEVLLEEQLRQAQKMEAIGALAGGIAHDFNNLLAIIIGNTELALDEADGTGDQSHSLDQILKASKRGRDLVRQILAFSRKSQRERKTFDVGSVVKETFELLRSSLSAHVGMNLDLRVKDATIIGDPSEIQQVIMNLATNAAYAMQDAGGTLTIRVDERTCAAGDRLPPPEMGPGDYVVLTVRDTGVGMSAETKKRAFEPFFTTKKPGQGTGMGLSVAYGIARSHGGDITVLSKPGKGSVFRVFLPKASRQGLDSAEKQGVSRGGSERILFIDDESALVEVGQVMLGRLGYRVTSVVDSVKALDIFAQDPMQFDLVVTDLAMPQMTGIALAERMRMIRRDIPIILTTGYSETVSPEKAGEAGIKEFLTKPIDRREMAETVRRVLDAAR